MTIKFSAGDEEPADVQAMTETMFRDAAEELTRVIQAIKAGGFKEAKAMPGVARDLNRALQVLIVEGSRSEKLRKQITGTVGARALDFDAARDEIGRRLARLRDADPG